MDPHFSINLWDSCLGHKSTGKISVRNLQYRPQTRLVILRYVCLTKNKIFKENSIHPLMTALHLQSQHFPVMRLDLLISAFAPSLGFQSIVFHGPSWVKSVVALQHQTIHSLSSINKHKVEAKCEIIIQDKHIWKYVTFKTYIFIPWPTTIRDCKFQGEFIVLEFPDG